MSFLNDLGNFLLIVGIGSAALVIIVLVAGILLSRRSR